jgi:uncharacterized membrane protein
MRLWLIPMIYVAIAVVAGLVLPRIEQLYLATYALNVSVSSAQAYLSAVASGMMALTGIVFAMAFVMVQFSAIAYSPRLTLWFARDPVVFHSLGAFSATFMLALSTLAWVDRDGSGAIPFYSAVLVGILLIFSMVLFSRLVQRLTDLQISSVLYLIGDKGREVIHEMFHSADHKRTAEQNKKESAEGCQLGPLTQTLKYSGSPRTVAKLDIDGLAKQAQSVDGVIVMNCAVGDTLVEDMPVLQIHGAEARLPEKQLMGAIHLDKERTFEQDPKYALRLLVDIAIKALSPAINDPTTAVQAIDQIEDLLRRLGRYELDRGHVNDANGVLRLVYPMPTWEDYLALAFDEIREYGATSVQVMRRLHSALAGLAESLPRGERTDAVKHYLEHLDLTIDRAFLDAEDRVTAHQEDRQGLGLSRRRA